MLSRQMSQDDGGFGNFLATELRLPTSISRTIQAGASVNRLSGVDPKARSGRRLLWALTGKWSLHRLSAYSDGTSNLAGSCARITSMIRSIVASASSARCSDAANFIVLELSCDRSASIS